MKFGLGFSPATFVHCAAHALSASRCVSFEPRPHLTEDIEFDLENSRNLFDRAALGIYFCIDEKKRQFSLFIFCGLLLATGLPWDTELHVLGAVNCKSCVFCLFVWYIFLHGLS